MTGSVGDAIAIVAADTQEIAKKALDLIDLEMESLPMVTNPVDAKKDSAPLVHEGGNEQGLRSPWLF